MGTFMEMFQDINWVIVFVFVILAFFVARLTAGKRQGEGLFSKVFQSNRDLDTSLGLIGMFGIIFVMLMAFHDDVKDQAGLVFLMAFYALRDLIIGKPKENNNGAAPPGTDH